MEYLYSVLRKDSRHQHLEPIGFKSPSFSSGSKLAWFEIHQNQDFALICPAQGYPVPIFRDILFLYSEPVGSKSPTFSNDVQFSGITRKTGQDFALLCQAQAFPVPIFR
ncbi:hypothetical protein HF086_005996 [Spodoptera exigua]|uniref:Uncharacterized protein n=1 Tax=Spodoptera exigua TaxID=7107 RepID=A0A922M6S3_SPOEX|nr:hypothetical protein HF086_005996 [Spodoptera exigua]